jgi:hypothetical protein
MMERGRHVKNSVLTQLDSWGVVLRRRTPWRELTPRQRRGMIIRGTVQVGLLAAALNDLRRRSAAELHGPKALWVAIACVNYLGIGPLVYFLFGRRGPGGGGSAA